MRTTERHGKGSGSGKGWRKRPSRLYNRLPSSLIRRKFPDQLHEPIVLHVKDLTVVDGIVYLPLYMTPLLVRC